MQVSGELSKQWLTRPADRSRTGAFAQLRDSTRALGDREAQFTFGDF